MRRRNTARTGVGRLAVFLLMLAFVLPNVLPVLAPSVAGHNAMAHDDCPGHVDGHRPEMHVQAGKTASTHSGQQSPSGDQSCCCSAMGAGVIPSLDFGQLPAMPIARGVAPRASADLKGLPPSSLSEPPRTSYQG